MGCVFAIASPLTSIVSTNVIVVVNTNVIVIVVISINVIVVVSIFPMRFLIIAKVEL